jgi:hypothetical protein
MQRTLSTTRLVTLALITALVAVCAVPLSLSASDRSTVGPAYASHAMPAAAGTHALRDDTAARMQRALLVGAFGLVLCVRMVSHAARPTAHVGAAAPGAFDRPLRI